MFTEEEEGQKSTSISEIVMTGVVDFFLIIFLNNYACEMRREFDVNFTSRVIQGLNYSTHRLYYSCAFPARGDLKEIFLQPYRAGMKMKIRKNYRQ